MSWHLRCPAAERGAQRRGQLVAAQHDEVPGLVCPQPQAGQLGGRGLLRVAAQAVAGLAQADQQREQQAVLAAEARHRVADREIGPAGGGEGRLRNGGIVTGVAHQELIRPVPRGAGFAGAPGRVDAELGGLLWPDVGAQPVERAGGVVAGQAVQPGAGAPRCCGRGGLRASGHGRGRR
jgi:hypothetical protein